MDQGRLAGAGNARHSDQGTEGERGIDFRARCGGWPLSWRSRPDLRGDGRSEWRSVSSRSGNPLLGSRRFDTHRGPHRRRFDHAHRCRARARSCSPRRAWRRGRARPPRPYCPRSAAGAAARAGGLHRVQQADGRFIQHVQRIHQAQPRALASEMRCASPPDSERVWRSSVRYPSPTSHKNEVRLSNSRRMVSAIPRSNLVSSRDDPALQLTGGARTHLADGFVPDPDCQCLGP